MFFKMNQSACSPSSDPVLFLEASTQRLTDSWELLLKLHQEQLEAELTAQKLPVEPVSLGPES
jgi:hypothetical protein